jgi:hypothetical protein
MKKDKEAFFKLALNDIEHEIQQWHQWDNPDSIDFRHRHYHKLEALVELLEVWDCNSVGGFGKGESRSLDLLERAGWLLNKYK